MAKWKDDIDPATIPDQVVYREVAKRNVSKRKKIGAPPKVLRTCPTCGQQFGAREMRAHMPKCHPPAASGS